jgi:hypothetical protein
MYVFPLAGRPTITITIFSLSLPIYPLTLFFLMLWTIAVNELCEQLCFQEGKEVEEINLEEMNEERIKEKR